MAGIADALQWLWAMLNRRVEALRAASYGCLGLLFLEVVTERITIQA